MAIVKVIQVSFTLQRTCISFMLQHHPPTLIKLSGYEEFVFSLFQICIRFVCFTLQLRVHPVLSGYQVPSWSSSESQLWTLSLRQRDTSFEFNVDRNKTCLAKNATYTHIVLRVFIQ